MKPLTFGQARALYVLLQGKKIGQLVRVGPDSDYRTPDGWHLAPWNLRVNAVAVRALVRLGYARSKNVLIDGREVKGAALVHMLGAWSTKYEVTRRGQNAWENATARERYGEPQYATMRVSKEDSAWL